MKAILVVDEMPNSCDECEVRCDGYTSKEYSEKGIKRPVWCPLKPMPEPRSETIGEDIADHEAHGWNLCLEEIKK